VIVVARAATGDGAVDAGRESVGAPAYAIRSQQRIGDGLWLQRWERTGLPAG
jgi:hypothetical protein